VQQAGGKVYDFKGGKDYIYGKEIVASNSHIADELISIIKSAYAE
jgi:myo-inositol-1(or 4)-monophosphatase